MAIVSLPECSPINHQHSNSWKFLSKRIPSSSHAQTSNSSRCLVFPQPKRFAHPRPYPSLSSLNSCCSTVWHFFGPRGWDAGRQFFASMTIWSAACHANALALLWRCPELKRREAEIAGGWREVKGWSKGKIPKVKLENSIELSEAEKIGEDWIDRIG